MIRVNGHFTQVLQTWMDHRGLSSPRLTARLDGLSSRDSIDAAEWRDLLSEAIKLCPEPDLGLQIGATAQVRDTGAVGYIVLNCETLADALETYVLFERHFYGVHFAELRSGAEAWTLCWPDKLGQENALFVHVALAALVTLLRKRFPFGCVLTNVALTGAPPARPELFEAFFGCPVTFHASYPGVSFDAGAIGQSDRGLLRGEFVAMRSQQHDAFYDVIRIQDPFTRRLRQTLLRLIPEGHATLQRVAEDLSCSPRSVQRRLQGMNLSYQQLLDRLREQLAHRYLLQTSLSLAEIGLLLGYSDQSAFNRAFKGWTGTTPGGYRKSGSSER
jgi:AraC-like DNA-binding protein